MSNIAKIKEYCISNGEGIRTAVFFSGCPHKCKGCFNKELWDYNYGKPFTKEIEKEIFSTMNKHISGISILGGEPLCDENYSTIVDFCKNFKKSFPKKDIWVWTGYTIEELKNNNKEEIFNIVDVIIDGRFIEEKKSLNLLWRGSSNQTINYFQKLKK